MAFFSYYQKIGEDVNAPEVQSFISKSSILSAAFEIGEEIPGVGGFFKYIRMGADNAVKLKNFINSKKKDVVEIDISDAEELYRKMPLYFANDLTDALENESNPLVVFLDTYEMCVNEMAVGEALNNDLWIRGEDGLIQNLPNVLWVIAGREKLKWERFDRDWSDAMDQHILGNLSRMDSCSFLSSAGITDISLQENLFALTKGTPVYLDICVDTYFSLIEKGKTPVIDDFGLDEYSLVERFARYMDDQKKDIVYMLSILGQWSDEMVFEVVKSCLPNFSVTTYEKVKGFSFISEPESGIYKMHQTVSDVFYRNCPEKLGENTVEKSVEFCKHELEKHSVTSAESVYYVNWLMDCGLRNDDIETFCDYYEYILSGYILDIIDAGRFGLIEHNFNQYLKIAEQSDDAYFLSLVEFSQARFFSHTGQYSKALEYYERVLAVQESTLGTEHPDTATSYNNIGLVYSDMGDYDKALAYYEKALAISETVFGTEDPSTGTSYNNIGLVYSNMGDYDKALEYYEKDLAICEAVLGTEHLDTATSYNNIGGIYNDMGDFDKALAYYEKALAIREAVLGAEHPDTAESYSVIGLVYANMDDYDKALEFFEKALEIQKQVLGVDHPTTQETLDLIKQLSE